MTLAEITSLITSNIDTTGRRLTTGIKMREVLNAIVAYLSGGVQVIKTINPIENAELLTLGATPVTLSIQRESGQSIAFLTGSCFVDYLTAPFATNTVVALRYVGADVPFATCSVLARTVTGGQYFAISTTCGVGQSQIIGDADIEAYVVGGNPTSGGGRLTIAVLTTVD